MIHETIFIGNWSIFANRGADCDTNHYLVIATVREGLPIDEQAAQNFDLERLNLRKLSELEVMKQYHSEITNRFAALENLNYSEDINRAQENIKGFIKIWTRDEVTGEWSKVHYEELYDL
jgi:hypothetical protein